MNTAIIPPAPPRCDLDTMVLLAPHRPTDAQKRIIRQHARGLNIPRTTHGKLAGFAYRVTIQQPRPELMPWLDWWVAEDGWKISAFDTCVDYPVATWGDAHKLNDTIARHLIEPYRRRVGVRNVSSTSTTRYTMPGKWNVRGFRSYPRVSKIGGVGLCVRLEYVAHGARQVRLAGIRRAIDLIDIHELWARLLTFKSVDVRRIGRQALSRGNAKTPMIVKWGPMTVDLELYAGHRVARMAAAHMDEEFATAQSVRQIGHVFKHIDARRALRPVDNAAWLPSPWHQSGDER